MGVVVQIRHDSHPNGREHPEPSQATASARSRRTPNGSGTPTGDLSLYGRGRTAADTGHVLTLHAPVTRTETVQRARAKGLSVIAALPYHYPRALLRAHHAHAIEVWAPPHVPADQGARHFQAYTCDIVVRGTAFLVEQGFGQVDAVLVPHGCDALQGMGSVLGDFVEPRPPVLTFYPPRSRRQVDRQYLVDELHSLADQLADITGHRPTRADWDRALALEEAADAALANLYAERDHLAVSDRDFYGVVRSREYLLAEDFAAMCAALPRGPRPRPGVPLMLGGIVAEPLALLDQLNDVGAHVVADDLACGWRRVLPLSDLADPFERWAARFFAGPPDSTRSDPVAVRSDDLIMRMTATGARGLLVYDLTFCEPELFYVPLLRQRLTGAGFPVLHLEMEAQPEVPSQTLTRIEAFVETLS